MHGEVFRVVGLRKNPDEPLGLTVSVKSSLLQYLQFMIFFRFQVQLDDQDNLVVARILGGGAIARQGLLQPGDVIVEVNGNSVNSPEELQSHVNRSRDSVTFKVAPASTSKGASVDLQHMQGQVTTTGYDGKKLTVSSVGMVFCGAYLCNCFIFI